MQFSKLKMAPGWAADDYGRCALLQDGRSLMVGCSDGQIRIFAPQSGRLIHTVHDAHQSAVLSLAASADGRMIITGDMRGYVKAWRLGNDFQSHVLLATMKEHKACVPSSLGRSCLQVECEDITAMPTVLQLEHEWPFPLVGCRGLSTGLLSG